MSAEVDSRASESPCQGNDVSSSPRASGPQDQDDRYNMSGVRKAFIICVTEERPGATTDVNNLQKSLQSLGFEVSECINPTSEEIFSSLEEYRDSIKDEVCCSFVFILAHGSEGKVMGRDGEEADLEEIFDMFNNEECLHLQQKPKVFVIQACRGDNKDRGAVSAGFRALSEELPMVSDTFVVYPSRPGYVAYRSPDQGSFMITFMTEVFKSHGNQEHLYDLFVRVNRRMVREKYEYQGEEYKTTVVMESTLTKAVYLKPT